MTALSVERVHGHRGSAAIPPLRSYLVADDAVILCGAIVALNATGYLTNAVSTDPTLRVVGVARQSIDNTNGGDGPARCEVEAGVFTFDSASGDGLITVADINRPCFVVDNQTVSRQDGVTRPYAGMVFDVDGTLIKVLLGVIPEPGVVDVPLEAAADLSALGNTFVLLDSAGKCAAVSAAGQPAFGVLLAGTASGAVGLVRTQGRCKVVASATIATGVLLATTSTGTSKDAAEAVTNTADAGGATDALIGSYVLGVARNDGATATLHTIELRFMGAIPTTAA